MIEPVQIHVLDKKVNLWQPASGFRTGLDAVMLAAACPAKKGQRVLDMGCGVGGASFCILERVPVAHVTGIDIQPDYIELAQENIALNEREGQAAFECADIRDFTVPDKDSRFDHVVCNPPYMEAGHHTPSPEAGKARAHGHDAPDIDLQDWIDRGFDLLLSGGSLTMIHRSDSVDRIIRGLGKKFGAIDIIPLWPKAGMDAKRVIVRATKDRKSPATIRPGIILHDENGEYTEDADNILRKAQKI